MKSISSIVKKYALLIILTISLVGVRAICELTLPEYTSNIVDVGISRKGIEGTYFTHVSSDTLNNIKYLLDEDEIKFIDEAYVLQDDYYELQDLSEEELTKLSDILMYPTALLSYLDTTANTEIGFLDLADYEDMLPKEELIVEQMSISFIEKEYQSLDINMDDYQMDYIIHTGAKMIGIAIIAAIVSIITSYLSSRVSAFFARDLRKLVTEKVLTYHHKEFTEISTASLITRTTNDITQVQMLLMMSMRMLCFAPIMGIGAVLKVWGNSLAWIIAGAVIFIIAIILLMFAFVIPKFKVVQDAIDKLNLVSREFISGIPVIRAFSNEHYQEEKFDKQNKNLTKISLFLNKITSSLNPLMSLIMNITCILIIWYGAQKIDLGTMQVGSLIAFITYTMHIIMSFLMISMFTIILPRAIVSIKRINEILKKEPSIQNKENLKPFNPDLKGTIEFKEVYFRYADAEEDILENISFKVEPGTTTAFIGSTGSGKSTLINLIPRFSDVTGGKILVDGVDIRDVDIAALRKKIGYVPQKGMLFSGTIKTNIALGLNHITKDDLDLAAKISCSKEFIDEKENSFDSSISQGGTNVSGGQRQRLAIARAVAKKPEIFIFDDSFSALDYKTDAKVRKLLDKNTKGATKLIVAQRVSTIMNADQIIVLDEGKIIDIGKHDELLERCSIYKEIASSQLKEVTNNA